MPTNRSQVRARHVLAAKARLGNVQGLGGGTSVIKGIPPKIINHGLLAAAAYATATPDEERVWGEIAAHLGHPDIDLIPRNIATLPELLNHLISRETDCRRLRLVTAETMEWLNFARRLI